MRVAYLATAMTVVLSAFVALPASAQTAAPVAADACPNDWTRNSDGDCDPPKGEVLGFSIAGLNAPAPAATAAVPQSRPENRAPSRTRTTMAPHNAMPSSSANDRILANFALGSTSTDQAAEAHVQSFVSTLGSDLGGKHIIVNGHTDARGSRQLNLRLSRHRAEAIRALLVKAGVAQDAVEVRGHAYDRLLRPRHPYAASNRRVDVAVGSN